MAVAEEEQDDHSRQSRVSGSRRTRSQVAPDWTAQESLTLVNEIAAVEGDCHKTLSSFQKWKIIVENCNALDVNRTLNQCRRKWESLLSDYNKIKQRESSSSWSESRVGSYWSLDNERRREFGFPEDFDSDVFKAIDDHLKAEDGSDTDPDNDPEAMADGVDVVAEAGSTKQRRQVVRKKRSTEERARPQKRSTDKKLTPQQSSVEEKLNPPKHRKDEKIMLENSSIEDKEQMMAAKLRENAELITAILNGNLVESGDYVLADLKHVKASQTDFTRRQGDNLITFLGNLADTLDQLCDLVQECG